MNKVLVKDRVSYALHNLREIIMMQMRARSESRVKRELKEDYVKNALDPEATEDVIQRLGSERTQGKHKHGDVTGEHECQTDRIS